MCAKSTYRKVKYNTSYLIYIYMLLFRYSKFLDFLNITLKIKYFYLKVLVEIQNSNNLRPRYSK